MGFFDFFKKKKDTERVGGMEDFMTLIRVYYQAAIAANVGITNIGMLPDVELEKFSYIGNSSLTGAYAMVISDQAIEKCAEVGANMTYLELSTHPGYMDNFVAACFIPHTDSKLFPHSKQEY